MDIFQFTFNPYVFLPLAAMLVYGFLLIRLYPHRLISKANGWFYAYLIASLCSGIPTIFMALSDSALDAIFWQSIFFVLVSFSFPMFVGFALHFMNRTKLISTTWFRVAMFVPATLIGLLTIFSGAVSSHTLSEIRYEHLMWVVPNGPLFEKTYIPHTMFSILICAILFTWHSFRIEDQRMRRQLRLFANAIYFQMALDTFIVLIFPKIFGTPLIPDSVMMTFFLGAIIAFGILKYELFTINPATVVTNIISTMSEVLIVLNPEGNIEFVNKATEDNLGYSESELVGKNIQALLSEDWAKFYKVVFEPIMKGTRQVDMEGFVWKKDKSKLPVNFSASAIKDNSNRVVGIVCVATDITHLKELYDITAERNKLSAIMESMSDGIIAIDENGKIMQTNRATLEIVELPEEALLGKTIEESINIHDKTETVSSQELLRVIQGESDDHGSTRRELNLITQAGNKKFIQAIATRLITTQSSNNAILTLHDLTEERLLDEMKVDFVSMAAHELRTPLTSVRGYISLFRNEYGTSLDEDQAAILDKATIASDRLVSLVEDLLSVAKVDGDGFTLKSTSQNLSNIIKKGIEDLRNKAAEREITIEVVESDAMHKDLQIDEMRMMEVMINLLSNAIKYSPAKSQVKIWVEEDQSEIKVFVQDKGPGIAKDAVTHLFSKFYRAPGKLEQTTRGTGLGLYISKKIVELHKGKIWVETEEGKGSVFAFSVPKPAIKP